MPNKVFGIAIDTQARRRKLVIVCYFFLLAVPLALWFLDHNTLSMTSTCIWAAIAVNQLAFGGYSNASYGSGLVKPFTNRPPREASVQSELIRIHLEELTHRPMAGQQPWQNDERELARRDAVHYRAYQPLAIAMVFIVMIAEWSLHRPTWMPAMLLPVLLYTLALPAALLALTLPQAIILWTEPDLTEAERSDAATTALPH